jgi:hypothetical protein
MNAEKIYTKIQEITEGTYNYYSQLAIIAKWIESEFEYKSKKRYKNENQTN